jgi:hypothetical protein
MGDVCDLISASARKLMMHPSYVAWQQHEPMQPGDVVLINNTFLFRDVQTKKSEQYLALRIGTDGRPAPTPLVATGLRLNSDLKRVPAKSSNLQLTGLDDAVKESLSRLGVLVFVLIGHIRDDIVLRRGLDHRSPGEIVWDPSLPDLVSVGPSEITVNDVVDEEAIWLAAETWYANSGNTAPQGLREALGSALDQLQHDALATLLLPSQCTAAETTMIEQIVAALRGQHSEYTNALAELAAGGCTAQSALHEVLRIAYNFSGDVTAFLRLVVSVCDLKPVVLWGTIAEHYALSRSLKALPGLSQNEKVALASYRDMIGNARNRAFHNALPFRKSLSVELPDNSLRGPALRIFGEHSRRSDNVLTYQDRELVEVLLEFTRAKESYLPLRFWQQNSLVMDDIIALFASTGEYLRLLAKETLFVQS